MKLPYIIIRTADHERLQKENRIMHNVVQSDTKLLHMALDRIHCLEDELEQYQQALEEMTESRNDMDFQAGRWFNLAETWNNKANEWRNRYELLAAEATAPRRTTEPEPQPAELAENCTNCSKADWLPDGSGYYCRALEENYASSNIERCTSYYEPAGGAAE